MEEVGNVRIFERTIWSAFKTEDRLSTQNLRGLRDDLLAKGPRFDIRAGPHFSSGRLEIRDGDLRQGSENDGKREAFIPGPTLFLGTVS